MGTPCPDPWDEVRAIAAFLKTLTGELPAAEHLAEPPAGDDARGGEGMG